MNTKETILKKAIWKAQDNGYKYPHNGGDESIELLHQEEIFGIIVSHDFAKALWGGGNDWADEADKPEYLMRLQEMVLEEDPIKYLEKFV